MVNLDKLLDSSSDVGEVESVISVSDMILPSILIVYLGPAVSHI